MHEAITGTPHMSSEITKQDLDKKAETKFRPSLFFKKANQE